ncbi:MULTISPECIES: hypothetical protein [unclassified Pseudomonas]|uniref:hypothetical protein n=1 Tax=unclassified Pseudomonas TaxID=196821 RepID=UPI00244A5863|nr:MULTISPECIES: hypothetical protein [unclassified Pseudomonas]MDG9928273.1 hypothetical protein [Pseudomonas sp. GD04042]MDH0481163.1 hypothetical protein [Pseudomonas sp. GD04015]MDH0604499.1 hypothetical protein [Pseudomonas sp. GD03869]
MSHRMRCKMICHSVTPNEHSNGELCTVELGAVYSEKKETEDYIYGKATPYGSFRAGIVTEVAQKMEIGKPYYVDIFPAE